VLYATFTVPLGNETVVTLSGTTTVRLRTWVAESELTSVTRTEKLLVPVLVGVPEMIPVLEASVSPMGSEPEAIDQA
jgi:ABC-type transport system involved in cytochrome c biogenesis permease component